MPTTKLPAGTVVVVPFPYSDRLAEKRRPALIVSGPAVAEAGYVWIAKITSARNTQATGDVRTDDVAAAGLSVASVVRPLKIACIEPSRVQRSIGMLPADTAVQVFTAIESLIGPA